MTRQVPVIQVKSRISEPPLNIFVLFQIPYILGRADKGSDKRHAERRLPDHLHLDAVAGAIEPGEVIGNLFPIDDRTFVAGVETKNRLR